MEQEIDCKSQSNSR
jgi:carbonic anhydrase/acetyltransferase-like protein (isoleucine patch superfamily)